MSLPPRKRRNRNKKGRRSKPSGKHKFPLTTEDYKKRKYRQHSVIEGAKSDERGRALLKRLKADGETEGFLRFSPDGKATAIYTRKKPAKQIKEEREQRQQEKKARKEAREMGAEAGKSDGSLFAGEIKRIDENTLLVEGETVDEGEYLGDMWEGKTQYSDWSGFTLPTLREMAGFEDPMGVGTFQEGGEGEMWLFTELVDEYQAAYDKAFLKEATASTWISYEEDAITPEGIDSKVHHIELEDATIKVYPMTLFNKKSNNDWEYEISWHDGDIWDSASETRIGEGFGASNAEQAKTWALKTYRDFQEEHKEE